MRVPIYVYKSNSGAGPSVSITNSLEVSSGADAIINANISNPLAGIVYSTLSADNGILTLSDTTGLVFTSGDGTSDASMAFNGNYHDVNAAISTIIYYVHDCSGTGLVLGSYDNYGLGIIGNILARNNIGMTWTQSGSASDRSWEISHNIFDANTSHGLQISTSQTILANIVNTQFYNNIFSNNGGYGVNFSAASVTSVTLDSVSRAGNCAYNNTSGSSNPAGILTDDPNLNPTYTSASTGNFSIGTNLKSKGYPLGGTMPVGKYSSTYSYVDPGAAQRQEAGGAKLVGASSLVTPGG